MSYSVKLPWSLNFPGKTTWILILRFTLQPRMKNLLLFTFAATAAAQIESGQYTGDSAREKDGNLQQFIVDKHNEYRTHFLSYDVTPKIKALKIQASNIEKVHWDDDLAQVAEDYARTCNFPIHSPYPYGENMAGTSGYASTYVITKATIDPIIMNRYGKREQKVDFPEQDIINHVKNGAKIDWSKGNKRHFSQLIWATSSKIGCGWAYCDLKRNGKTKKQKVEVCEYLAAGNVRGIDWFKIGKPCTACACGTSCDASKGKKLCDRTPFKSGAGDGGKFAGPSGQFNKGDELYESFYRPNDFTRNLQPHFVKTHNAYARSLHRSNAPTVSWDRELARQAEITARTCKRHTGRRNYLQNMATVPDQFHVDGHEIKRVVEHWGKDARRVELKRYNYRNVEKIGCAYAFCYRKGQTYYESGFKPWARSQKKEKVVVCNYRLNPKAHASNDGIDLHW